MERPMLVLLLLLLLLLLLVLRGLMWLVLGEGPSDQ